MDTNKGMEKGVELSDKLNNVVITGDYRKICVCGAVGGEHQKS